MDGGEAQADGVGCGQLSGQVTKIKFSIQAQSEQIANLILLSVAIESTSSFCETSVNIAIAFMKRVELVKAAVSLVLTVTVV